MIKRIIHTAIALAALAVMLVSCRQDDLSEPMPPTHGGVITIRKADA